VEALIWYLLESPFHGFPQMVGWLLMNNLFESGQFPVRMSSRSD
jgi:hypothetical protein